MQAHCTSAKMIQVYTDGGIKPGEIVGRGDGGTGVVVVKDRKVIETLSTYHLGPVTNQQMELQAAIEGIDLATGYAKDNKELIQVVSDSAYLVNCFDKAWWYNWVTKYNWKKSPDHGWASSSNKPVENVDLWRELLSRNPDTYKRLSSPSFFDRCTAEDREVIMRSKGCNPLSYIKIKGHSGNPLNELADQLATTGKMGAYRK
jgi:ribonuclease HI